MQTKILQLLQQSNGEFLSGESMSRQLGVSRAAVWKHIRQLQQKGIEIQAVTRKGYRLCGDVHLLDQTAIASGLHTRVLGRQVILERTLDSTNRLARALAQQGCIHGSVVIADQQTGGRGRRGREWFSAPGENLYMSLILRPALEPRFAPRYTIGAALSIYRMLSKLQLKPAIKWPNDVLVNGKKISGILLEMEGTIESLDVIIVGVGLNINTMLFPPELCGIATSLAQLCGHSFDRNRITAMLLNEMEPIFEQCENDDSYLALWKEYKSCCSTIGQLVDISGVTGVVTGIVEDIDEMGRLLLKTDDGLQVISAGDVSLRPAGKGEKI